MTIKECSATQGLATDESVMIESRPANCALKAEASAELLLSLGKLSKSSEHLFCQSPRYERFDSLQSFQTSSLNILPDPVIASYHPFLNIPIFQCLVEKRVTRSAG